MSQQQQQLVMLVMLVIIITHTPCACLDAFSFSADRVVLASFLIGTAFARSFLYCAVWCDDDDDDEAGAHTYTSVSVHYCQLLATTNESSSRRCAPFGLRVRSIRRPVTIFVLLLLLLLLRAVRVDEADNDSVHVPCALCCVRTM